MRWCAPPSRAFAAVGLRRSAEAPPRCILRCRSWARGALLTRCFGAQTDLAHDSVHAAQRAAEKEAACAAEAKKPVSGRLLDSGAAKAKADKTDEPPKPTLNSRVHHHNPDCAPPRAARPWRTHARVGSDAARCARSV